jgi:Secretion system C-terminal sorting domain
VGDGSIVLKNRNSEPFKSGTIGKILVTTSEKLPNLQLSFSNGSPISLTAVGTSGKQWQAQITFPNSTTKKAQLQFVSGTQLFGLILNQDAADVKRNLTTGAFATNRSTDTNHEIQVCPSDNLLNLEVTPNAGNQQITLVATGGMPPYKYSIDAMPVSPTLVSTFTTITVHNVEVNKNYLLKVRDATGCQAEEYYTLPKVDCSALVVAGAQGIDTKQVNLGSIPGMVKINYDMYSIPDKITVKYRANTYTTGTEVSGTGTISFVHTIQSGQSNIATIIINAPNVGTAWEYKVNCPSAAPNAIVLGTTTREYQLQYQHQAVLIQPMNLNDNAIYTLNYKEVYQSVWQSIPNIVLPFELRTEGKEFEINLKRLTALNNAGMALQTYPNPSSGPIWIHFHSKEASDIVWSIYNSEGKLVYNQQAFVEKGTNTLLWKPELEPSGLYLVKVLQDNRVYNAKALVKK